MIKNKKIICIIPARGGSKGLKDKNIKLVNGHPLIAYPIRTAIQSNLFESILVSTDNKKIASVAKKYGADVPFLRKKKYAKDYSTTEETLKNALNEYETYKKIKYDIGVYMTATDIFRTVLSLKKAVYKLINNRNIDSCFSVRPTHKNYWHNKNKNLKRILNSMKTYSSRQQKQPIYREDTGLLCASRAKLWRNGKRIGDKVEFIINHNPIDIDIHSDYDLYLVKKTFEYFKKNKPNYLPKIL
ncbi:MAG: acylneuraminate cytidylyltransferase [Pelagibacteraceae bacterium]|nr:acylneuraminate cytidylyltransferase [Pelagibacteraceae bacterium]|tara:strand:- start:4960 stop:5688 length:729 start_codon:yes stop_codon:yes gene_type:complete